MKNRTKIFRFSINKIEIYIHLNYSLMYYYLNTVEYFSIEQSNLVNPIPFE